MPKFQVNRKKFGLTYSCPRDAEENPISDCARIKDFLYERGGNNDYVVAEERHNSGKKHFHVYVDFSEALRSKDERIFDIDGVHPNIIKPGKGWVCYCVKEFEFITNFYEESGFVEASKKRTWAEASAVLWEKEPKWMLQYASVAEKNFAKRVKTRHAEV